MDAFTTFASSPEQAATQLIRDWCGWHVAPVITSTITLDGTGTDTILLPSRRVVEVDSVKVDGVELDAHHFEWSADGLLRMRRGCWPDHYRSIEVTMLHGFQDVSALADVVASIVARVKVDPTGAVATQRAGTQAVSFFSGAMGGGLMQSEKERLAPYQLTWGP